MRLTAALAALLIFDMSLPARADEVTRLGRAREVVVVTHVADKLYGLLPLLTASYRRALIQRGTGDASNQAAALQRYQERCREGFSHLIDDVVTIYANNLSEDDLAALSDFYRTPSGARALAKEKEIGNAIAVAAQNWGKDISDRLEVELETVSRPAGLLDPQRWRAEYIANPRRAAVIQRYVDPMETPELTALRTITLAKLLNEQCHGSSMDRNVLDRYTKQTGLDQASISDLDTMGLEIAMEFTYFDGESLQTMCAAADDLFGDKGRLVPKLLLPGNGIAKYGASSFAPVRPFLDFAHEKG